MKSKFINPYSYVLLIVAAVLILAGSMFKLQHWPNGAAMERIGFVSFFFIASYEIRRLRKVIKALTADTSEAH